MKRRPFRPTLYALEPRIALSSSSSSFFSSLFGSLFGTGKGSSSSHHHAPQHTLAYYQKLAPHNAQAAHIVQVVMQRRERAAELRAAQHAHAG